jgi:hypothetical protein
VSRCGDEGRGDEDRRETCHERASEHPSHVVPQRVWP